MTCVPCTPEPGLNILDLESREWIEIERFLKPQEEVSVFCAQIFQELSGDLYLAALHRVSKSMKPRLSLVYELRPKAGFQVTEGNF
jgi:isopenicillin N synthase-like dioxygenase